MAMTHVVDASHRYTNCNWGGCNNYDVFAVCIYRRCCFSTAFRVLFWL